MFQEGQAYFIRTVTYSWLGVFLDANEDWVRITSATWVADSGRFADALRDPDKLNELEPAPDVPVMLNRGAIVDCVPVNYDPPREQR